MSDETIKELIRNLPMIITAMAALIASFGGILVGWFTYKRAGESILVSQANAKAIEEVHKTTNGQSEKLSKLSEAVGFAKGEKKATAEGVAKAVELLSENTSQKQETAEPLKVEIIKIVPLNENIFPIKETAEEPIKVEIVKVPVPTEKKD